MEREMRNVVHVFVCQYKDIVQKWNGCIYNIYSYIYLYINIYIYIFITQSKAFLTEFDKAGLGAAKQGLAAANQAWADRPGHSKAVPGRSKTGWRGSPFRQNAAKQSLRANQGLGAARPGILMKETEKWGGQKCVRTTSACADRLPCGVMDFVGNQPGITSDRGGKCVVCVEVCWVVRC